MILKVTTRYALCATTYLASHGIDKTIKAKEISVQRKIPLSYLPRILSALAKANIVRSYHGGREKGYRMHRSPSSISLFEVFDIFEQWSQKQCLLRPADESCDCGAKYKWKEVERRMFLPLQEMTIGDLLEKPAMRKNKMR